MRWAVLLVGIIGGCSSGGDDDDTMSPTPTPWDCPGGAGFVSAGGTCGLTAYCVTDGSGLERELDVDCTVETNTSCICFVDGVHDGAFVDAGDEFCSAGDNGQELTDRANIECDWLLPPDLFGPP